MKLAFVTLVALVGCSADGTPAGRAPFPEGGLAADGGAGGARPSDASPEAPHDARRADAEADLVFVEAVVGRAVDERGDPVAPDTLVTACGPARCNPAATDAAGAFRVEVGFELAPEVWAVQIHVRPHRAAFYYPFPERTTSAVVDVGDLVALDLPATGPAIRIDRAGAPAQSVTEGDVTLHVGEGVFVRLDVESNLAGAVGAQLRTRRVPASLLDAHVPPDQNVLGLWAIEPFECSFELPGDARAPVDARVTLANVVGLSPGDRVEFLALGSYVFPEWIEPGAFELAARGQVSADGTRIEMDPGEGVRHLTWIGVRSDPRQR